MKGVLIPVLFALSTALCWALYGPTLAKSRSLIGEWSPFKPYVFIGVAYLVWAIGGGLFVLAAHFVPQIKMPPVNELAWPMWGTTGLFAVLWGLTFRPLISPLMYGACSMCKPTSARARSRTATTRRGSRRTRTTASAAWLP